MYVCLPVALCDCVYEKNRHQLGLKERICIPGLFQAFSQLVLPGIQLATPTSQVVESSNPLPEGPIVRYAWVQT